MLNYNKVTLNQDSRPHQFWLTLKSKGALKQSTIIKT